MRADGQYHLEDSKQDGSRRAFEGSVPIAEVQNLEQLLERSEVANLSQHDIVFPFFTPDTKQLLLQVFRSDAVQTLRWFGSDSMKAHRQLVDPLLQWFRAVQKRRRSPADGRLPANRCMPAKFESKTRNSANAAPPGGVPLPGSHPEPHTPDIPYLVQMYWHAFNGTRAERTCVIVYPGGHYRFEESSQVPEGKSKLRAFEDVIDAPALEQLRAILDDPELKSIKHYPPLHESTIREFAVTHVTIPRGNEAQRLRFEDLYGLFGSDVRARTDREEKVVEPLRRWMKASIERRRVPPVPDAVETNCVPQKDFQNAHPGS